MTNEITPKDVTTEFAIIHQSLYEFPATADIAPVVLKSILFDEDLNDNLLIKILGGKNKATIKRYMQRLDNNLYPQGWPHIRWTMGEAVAPDPVPKPTDGGDPDPPPPDPDPPKPPDVPDAILGEWMTRIIPPLPIRLEAKNYDEEGFPMEKRAIRTMGASIGVDTDRLLKAILDSDSFQEQPDAIDNVYVGNFVKLWDMCEPAKHYLFDLFHKIWQFREDNNIGNDPGPGPAPTDGGEENDHPSDGASMQGIFAYNDIYKAVFDYDHLEAQEFSMGEVMANPELKIIYFSNTKKLDVNGNLKKTFYASTGDLYLACGYLAKTPAHVREYMRTGVCPRAEPRVADDHRYRGFFRVESPIKIQVKVEWPKEPDDDKSTQGVIEEVDRILPGYLYGLKENSNTVLAIAPASLLVALDSGEQEIKNIIYYKIHETGIDIIRVISPYGGMYINDGQTDEWDAIYVWGLKKPLSCVIHFFPHIIDDYKNYDATDVFYASLQTTILVSAVKHYHAPWWHIVLTIIIIIIIVVVSVLTYGTTTKAMLMIAKALFVMMALSIASKIVMKYVKNKILAAIIIIVIAVIAGNYDNILGAFGNAAVSLPKILLEFADIMQRLYTGYVQEETKSLAEDLMTFQDAQQDKLNALAVQSYSSGMDVNLLLENNPQNEYNSINTSIVDPEAYFDGFEHFTELGTELLDVDQLFNQTLDTQLIT